MLAVSVGDGAQYAAGITDGEAVRRDIFSNDAAGTNDAARADGHAGQDDDAAAEPDVVFDGNRRGLLPARAAQCGMQRMADGVERDVRREQDVVADMHRAAVQNGAAAVGVEMAAKADAAAVVAVKRRGDMDAFRQFAEKFGE